MSPVHPPYFNPRERVSPCTSPLLRPAERVSPRTTPLYRTLRCECFPIHTPLRPHPMSRGTPGCKPPLCAPPALPCPWPPSAAPAGPCRSGGTVGRARAGPVSPRGSAGQATGTGQQLAEVAPSGPVEVTEVDGHKQEDKEPVEPHERQGQRVPAGWTLQEEQPRPPMALGRATKGHRGLQRTPRPLSQHRERPQGMCQEPRGLPIPSSTALLTGADPGLPGWRGSLQ